MKRMRHVDSELLAAYRVMPCKVCHSVPSDPAHLKTRGAGGPDHPINVIPLCRHHHVMQHSIGIVTFINRFPRLRDELFDKGWEIVQGKLVNSQLSLFEPSEEILEAIY